MPRNENPGPPQGFTEQLPVDQIPLDNLPDHVTDTLPFAPSQLAILGGFTAATGWEVWSFDGTTLTLLADINDGTDSSYPFGFTEFNDALYFSAYDGTNYDLWTLDADGNPDQVTDINPDGFSFIPLWNSAELNGTLYFIVSDGEGDNLWKLDADGNAVQVTDSNPTWAWEPTEFDGALYFTATGDGTGSELWTLDANENPVQVTDINPDGVSFVGELNEFNGALHFLVFDNSAQRSDLWKLDANGNPVQVTDINPDGSSYVHFQNAEEVNGSLYFVIEDRDARGSDLWKLDSDGSLVQVTDIDPDPVSYVGSLTEFNGTVYFTVWDGRDEDLWKLDGNENPVQVSDINPDGYSSVRLWSATEFNDALYFTVWDGEDEDVWKLDADDTLTEIDFFDADNISSYAWPNGVVNDTLVVNWATDTNGDEDPDQYATYAATGDPTSAADFQPVDDGSGTFWGGGITVFEDGLLVV